MDPRDWADIPNRYRRALLNVLRGDRNSCLLEVNHHDDVVKAPSVDSEERDYHRRRAAEKRSKAEALGAAIECLSSVKRGAKKPEPRRTEVAGKMRTAAEVRSLAETSAEASLQTHGRVTALRVAGETGLSRINARRALERLVRQGKATKFGLTYKLVKP